MANFLGILQSEWAGAQAFSSFDTYLAPYVFKDKLSFEEVLKAVRSFIYNLNVPARWGQSPFTNITLDWVVPSDLKEQIPTRNDNHLFKNSK
jgi:anaerobic ribonucleoside-triphosphate reductase